MNIQFASTPGGKGKNEDLIVTIAHGASSMDFLIFDGASSVSDRHYFDRVTGDPAWFVNSFAAALKTVTSAAPAISQADSVMRALRVLRQEHHEHMAASHIPAYASPIAAMTWLRLKKKANDITGDITADIYALGDCKLLLLNEANMVCDLDPYTNPQESILRAEIEKLKADGLDEKMRWQKLLPMLRDRRASQNASEHPSILCLHPQGPFTAREQRLQLKATSQLLATTDGFYRLVDTYHLYDAATLMKQCTTRGLDALMMELRDYEARHLSAGNSSVKKVDDATVAIIGL